MNKTPAVSVIIPVYNVEPYLAQCLDSLLAQTFQDFEIICVDDGSTDGSGAILRQYQERDPRLRALAQSHAYAGAARNLGMDAASGEYLLFLDSDDFFEPELLDLVYGRASQTKADVVTYGGRKYSANTGEYKPAPHYFQVSQLKGLSVFSRHDLPDQIMTFTTPAPWTKMFRREYITSQGLRFQPLHNTNDAYFTMMALCLAERIAYVDRILVNYRVGIQDSVQNTRRRDPLCFLEALRAIRQGLADRGILEEVAKSYQAFGLSICAYAIRSFRGKEGLDQILEAMGSKAFANLSLLGDGDAAEEMNPMKGNKDYELVKGMRYAWQCKAFVEEGDSIPDLGEKQPALPEGAGEKDRLAWCLYELGFLSGQLETQKKAAAKKSRQQKEAAQEVKTLREENEKLQEQVKRLKNEAAASKSKGLVGKLLHR